MPRQRAPSGASTASSHSLSLADGDQQELGSMYDYLAKIILLGPSGCGKSCLLHRFVKEEWRVLTSQTIGVEFASKIIKVGTGNRRKRIKLQLWDTAGQERFRSVTRSYYRGAAGALMIYDMTRHASFKSLPTFLSDAKALASPNLTVILVGNKSDLSTPSNSPPPTPPLKPSATNASIASSSSISYLPTRNNTKDSSYPSSYTTMASSHNDVEMGHQFPPAREVTTDEASRWASSVGIPVALETSALNGENVDEVFERLARMILTKIELGEIDVDDSRNGIQYGDSGDWLGRSNGYIGSGGGGGKGKGKRSSGTSRWGNVLRLDGGRRKSGCC